MPKKVILVGHCGPDASYLRMAVQKALQEAVIIMADDDAELRKLLSAGADLVLVNRVLDYGFATEGGAELIKHLRTEFPDLRNAGQQLSRGTSRSGRSRRTAGIWKARDRHSQGFADPSWRGRC